MGIFWIYMGIALVTWLFLCIWDVAKEDWPENSGVYIFWGLIWPFFWTISTIIVVNEKHDEVLKALIRKKAEWRRSSK